MNSHSPHRIAMQETSARAGPIFKRYRICERLLEPDAPPAFSDTRGSQPK